MRKKYPSQRRCLIALGCSLFGAVLPVAVTAATHESTESAAPFNVLFLAIDDLRPQTGAYGYNYMHTPRMDQLASEGRLFTRHYVQVPICNASRYAMLTGQLPSPERPGSFAYLRGGEGPPSMPQWGLQRGQPNVS